jgi:hypothetical protein
MLVCQRSVALLWSYESAELATISRPLKYFLLKGLPQAISEAQNQDKLDELAEELLDLLFAWNRVGEILAHLEIDSNDWSGSNCILSWHLAWIPMTCNHPFVLSASLG